MSIWLAVALFVIGYADIAVAIANLTPLHSTSTGRERNLAIRRILVAAAAWPITLPLSGALWLAGHTKEHA